MHFLRAIYNKSLKEENFEMHACKMDSLSKEWITCNEIDENEVYVGFNPGSVTLYHQKRIVIFYIDNHPALSRFDYKWTTTKYKSAIIISDSIQVYKNGYYPAIYDVSWGGTMSMDRIAEMLPYDFIPRYTEYGKKDIEKESSDQ